MTGARRSQPRSNFSLRFVTFNPGYEPIEPWTYRSAIYKNLFSRYTVFRDVFVSVHVSARFDLGMTLVGYFIRHDLGK